jgi:hypothetical protein
MSAVRKEALAIIPAADVAGRVKALEWERASKDLEAQGHVTIGSLITPYATGDDNGASAIQSGVQNNARRRDGHCWQIDCIVGAGRG